MGDDQKVMKKRLKVLMNRQENQVCADCPERQPRWASLIVPPPGAPPGSLQIGAFMCLECSGSHRRLGVHIAFVRSINLDSWKEKEVLAMENGGNSKVNAIFEARLAQSGVRKPSQHADGPTRERFIRDKYERRKFYDPAAFANLPAPSAEPAAAAPAAAAVGPPSDAARLRMEQRRLKKEAAKPSPTVRSRDRSRSRTPPRLAVKKPGSELRRGTRRSNSSEAKETDLLDLNFDAAPAPAPQPVAPAPAPQQQQAPEAPKEHDLFNFLVADKMPGGGPAAQQAQGQPKKPSSADIMSLYSNNANNMQSSFTSFASASVSGILSDDAGTVQSNTSNNSNGGVNAMTNMMGQMNFQQPMNPQQQQQMMMLMQQQQQQMMMMQRQNPQMMQQRQQPQQQHPQMMNMIVMPSAGSHMMGNNGNNMGNNNRGMMGNNMMMMNQGNMMGGNNNMMMMQQQQQHMMNNNNNNGFGAPMGSGPPISSFQVQQQRTPSMGQQQQTRKEDPFAQFGVNHFR